MFDNNNADGKYDGRGGRGRDGGDDLDYELVFDNGTFDAQRLPQHLRMMHGDDVPTSSPPPFPRPREYRELREKVTAGQQIVGVLFGAFMTIGVCWLAYQGRYVTRNGQLHGSFVPILIRIFSIYLVLI